MLLCHNATVYLSLSKKLPLQLPTAQPSMDGLPPPAVAAGVQHHDFHLVSSLQVPWNRDAASKIMPKKVRGDSQLDFSSFSIAWGQNRLMHSGDQVFCNSLSHALAPDRNSLRYLKWQSSQLTQIVLASPMLKCSAETINWPIRR